MGRFLTPSCFKTDDVHLTHDGYRVFMDQVMTSCVNAHLQDVLTQEKEFRCNCDRVAQERARERKAREVQQNNAERFANDYMEMGISQNDVTYGCSHNNNSNDPTTHDYKEQTHGTYNTPIYYGHNTNPNWSYTEQYATDNTHEHRTY